jgi:hypothetical protein
MRWTCCQLGLLLAAAGAWAGDNFELFEKKVRPLFVAKCHDCHGVKLQMGGLNLATAEGFRKGSAGGPLVDEGDPAKSRLLVALSHTGKVKMPPAGKLSDAEIAAVREWIEAGAPWPETAASPSAGGGVFWSFAPLAPAAPPAVRNPAWARNDVDRFILARLEREGLAPAPPADQRTWLRRVTYDLTGLPPTETEIRAFLDDASPEARARVVDRLLASPRYGERWGRHWLDVARYADSTGADEDHRYPHAWRYRDYVIDAFNRDLPFDQFMREQVAGDLLPSSEPDGVNRRGLIATGFLALGPKLIAEQDKVKMFYDIVDEQIDVVGRAFLGLTLACARCHDHKFDPISTRDYYALASIFASTRQLAKLEGTVSQLLFVPLAGPEETARWQAHKGTVEDKQKEMDELLAEEGASYRGRLAPEIAAYMLAARAVYRDGGETAQAAADRGLDAAVLARWVDYLKPTKERRAHLEEWYQAAEPEAAARLYQERFLATARERDEARAQWRRALEEAKARGQAPPEPPRFLAGENRFYSETVAAKGPLALPEENREAHLSEAARARLQALQAELKTLRAAAPPDPPLACAVVEGEPVTQHVFVRGNPEAKGEAVPKRFPAALAGDRQPPIAAGSGRRELAAWLSSPANPLVARVIVNRLWQWHFGEGLVRTPSNFGRLGDRPVHPELLDYLAARFVREGWSLKQMHRLLVLSSAYGMSSQASPAALAKDPENRLWSHFLRRRLAVEEIRDSLLAADGSLDLTMGGSLQAGEGTDQEFAEARKSLNPDEVTRRLVYLPLRRSNLPSLLNLFDFGDATTSSEGRTQTNVAPQALFMMNSPFVAARAGNLARQLLAGGGRSDAERVAQAYYRILSRPPEPEETGQALAYLDGFPGGARQTAWSSFCRALMASNEFLYLF